MKIYSDENNINILQTISSASTLIGSLSHVAREYILSKFPKGYFKHVYVDTSETVVQQSRNDSYNNLANKIPYPSMTISPEISLSQPIGGMEKSMHLSSPNLYMRKDAIREYRKLVLDPDSKFSLLYTGDYITTNFNFKIITDSFIKNADIAFFLKSKFQEDFFQYLNGQHLQTEIPKSFIKFIANINNWDLDDPDDMDSLRLYLIGTGKRPETIQKRKSLSTGKDCFFINDTFNLLTLFTDLDVPASINRNSQVEGEYTITFRLQISSYLTNSFILSLNKSALKKVSEETVGELTDEYGQFEDGQTASISVSLGEILTKKDVLYFYDAGGIEHIGHLMYTNQYTYSVYKDIPELYLLEEMPDEYQKIHSYAVNKLNLDTTSLIHVKIFSRNGKQSGENYSFNTDAVSIKVGRNVVTDFAVAVYVNRLLYETIKKAMLSDKDFFNDGYMTNMIANIAGERANIRVKKFEDKRAESSSKPEMSLRIKTAYGIGYVSLLDDTDEDGYKVCVGFDAEDNPIIKRFEIQR